MIEEEWSYIPVGGPLPLASQTVTAFGAAANLVHPATGYSIARSLREAPDLAVAMAAILKRQLPVRETAEAVWDSLWPAEKRRQVSDINPVHNSNSSPWHFVCLQQQTWNPHWLQMTSFGLRLLAANIEWCFQCLTGNVCAENSDFATCSTA